MDEPGEMQGVVMALTDQIGALLPWEAARQKDGPAPGRDAGPSFCRTASLARSVLGEAAYAAMAGRTGQIRHEAMRGVNDKTLLEDKVWLDRTLAELLGLVADRPS